MRLAPVILSLATVSLAAPAGLDHAHGFSDVLPELYGKISKYINDLRHNLTPPGTCNPSKIALPPFASSLPSSGNLKPMYVALGRGTQNYTCADSTSNSIPVAIGAVANLYNATCIAASYPDLMEMLPNIAYTIPLPSNQYAAFPPANLQLMGHHFFYDLTTPEFNFDITRFRQYGIAMTKKKGSLGAPLDAVPGEYGAVDWLYLSTTTGTVGRYKSVYRVNTASGSPPHTCQDMPPTFEIQYAANYYFFGS